MTRRLLTIAIVAALTACNDQISISAPPPPPPPPPATVLLKDVVYDRLPSPYYHFEYDGAGKINSASFASGAATYSVTYQGDRIHDIAVGPGAGHVLFYTYDDAGRVAAIRDRDATGANAQLWFFTYTGNQLVSVERDRAVTGGFIIDLQMGFLYDTNGNLLEMSQHYPAIDGVQTEQTFTDVFERYDDKVNVDDFDLLHPGFFDQLILLPGIKLQVNNPGRVVHVGDGPQYTIDYTYTYNEKNRPLTRSGTLLYVTGPNAGQTFTVGAAYSYY